jgi:prepilin-type N-terminal cleavage/methylation domain-containing protein
MKKISIKGFTLVELIVVITILVILSAVGYVSYTSYLLWVRDTNRISQLKSIWDWLNLYKVKNTLPLPDDKISIESSWSIIAYQWYAWKTVLWKIDYSSKWQDPKDDTYFSYYLTNDKKYLQLLWHLEEESNLSFGERILGSQTNAVDYTIRFLVVSWAKLWILTGTWTDLNKPVQEITALKSAGKLDIKNATGSYISTLRNKDYVSGTWWVLQDLKAIATAWWVWYTSTWSSSAFYLQP